VSRSRPAPHKPHDCSTALDLSYFHSVPLVLRQYDKLTLCLVGCGGSGSWLAPHVARLARVLRDGGRDTQVLFVDPDIIEERNIARQHFCFAEIGQPKVAALAGRYNAALGLDIEAMIACFEPKLVEPASRWNTLTVLIGCVDNAAARQSLAQALSANRGAPPSVWWLDCGNARESGQVLVGSALAASDLREAFPVATLCTALPAPSLQASRLLEPQPDEAGAQSLSCAELAVQDAQSLAVNQTAAAIATDYLVRMLLSHDLRRFATHFDLSSGSARSQYITPEHVAAAVGKPPGRLFKRSNISTNQRQA
jgi:PRTRC genetic system ThiF family protein